ncbi:hypothetical protein LTR70_001767 [Exophiala xenobiotica]|uniref:Uncharacterized protein n=1 Tax=Lithohypha guttulata TaxID=1690604 RepID=A0ABR0KM96_9EURO|nr:hypothetical protein LTR24_001040 [Lithohypha guttulata]KAK5327025.1 hypothetical protein LTR70_001767 [Exophiala xenobiotica]
MKQALLLTVISIVFTHTHARFGQEVLAAIVAIRDVQGGAPGVAPTIAGAAISDLLAGTNACDKLKRGDQILAELGEGDDAVAAAIDMVAAEKNFNPFAQDIPTIRSDATLPQNAKLRGITPLIDPAVRGADVANALSDQTKGAPLNADGKSVADLLAENGFTNFTSQDATGGAAVGADQQGDSAATATASNNNANQEDANANSNTSVCGGAAANGTAADTGANNSNDTTSGSDSNSSNDGDASNSNSSSSSSDAANSTDTSSTNTSTSTGAEDFGSCDPTMSIEGGRNGRPATEFTFQSNDPAIASNQQEALNPNIITNRICDELTNICGANDAAKTTCLAAKEQVLALGTRDEGTAEVWNGLVGVGSGSGSGSGSGNGNVGNDRRRVRRGAGVVW